MEGRIRVYIGLDCMVCLLLLREGEIELRLWRLEKGGDEW